MTPSWGEPYTELAGRMRAAVTAARSAARGHEAVLVSHQLPVWIARLDAEQRRFVHDPRKRQCGLASLTSLTFDDDRLVAITYTEPSADLVRAAERRRRPRAPDAVACRTSRAGTLRTRRTSSPPTPARRGRSRE